MYSRLLLALGYLSAPFAGPGSAVITAAGWLSYGAEARKPSYGWVGLAGLLGVAGILAGEYGSGPEGVAALGGMLLMAYYVLSIAMIWVLGIKTGNGALKAAAMLLAVAFLLAATGAGSVQEATVAASGGVADWAGVSWANQAASGVLEKIGGPGALARLFAAAGAVAAAAGFLGMGAEGRGVDREEAVFGIGVY